MKGIAPVQHFNALLPQLNFLGVSRFSPLVLFLGAGILGQPVQAQITPDPTLGNEASIVVSDGVSDPSRNIQIKGGAIRSEILFHSFSEFNVLEQQGAYFVNPEGVTNILSRVTGANRSDILGTLGVFGDANLFFLNPNGIVFGPDAFLDIAGSFVATTADRFTFGDGSEFSAVNPNAAPLLNVTAPVGLQYGMGQSGSIINSGQLEVGSGQALTLMGETVVNTGTLAAQGGEVAIASLSGPTDIQLDPQGQIQEINSLADLLGPSRPDAQTIPDILADTIVDLGMELTPDGQVAIASSSTIIPTASGDTMVSGVLNVSNGEVGQVGGTAIVLGDRVALVDTAFVDVSGDAGGGVALLGGGYQGQGTLANAQQTYLGPNTFVNADAGTEGNGGVAIAWADYATNFYGTISGRGGRVAGDGGFVEVSGKQQLTVQGDVFVDAANGALGTLLLDPENIIIAAGSANGDEQQNSQLDPNVPAGDPVGQILAEQGTATFTIFENKLESLAGTANVILEATNDITIETLSDGELTFQAPASQDSAGTIQLTADAAGAGDIDRDGDGNRDGDGIGTFSMDVNDTINTNGRDITISGASLTIGSITTSPSTVVRTIDVDAGGAIPAGAPDVSEGTSTFTFTVPNGTEMIRDLDVRFSAAHTYTGDLTATLEDPNNTQVVLFDGVGGSGDNFQDTLFDSDAPESVSTASAPFDGTVAPQDNLGGFDNISPVGNWTLTVTDNVGGDSGQLFQANDQAPWGSVIGTQLLITTEALDGDGGTIDLSATNGSLLLEGQLDTSTQGGNGGAITLQSLNGSVNLNGDVTTSSLGGTDGTVTVTAVGETSDITFTGSEINTRSNVTLKADNAINFTNLDQGLMMANVLALPAGTGGITFTADADNSGQGAFMMEPVDTIRTAGRDITIAGAELTVGTIDTTRADTVAIALDPFSANNPNGAIPETGTSGESAFSFTVPENVGSIQDLDLQLAIEHTYVGDLTIQLTAPADKDTQASSSVTVLNSVGGDGDNFQDTILDSEATLTLQDSSAPFIGTYQPQGTLSVFNGLVPGGNWTLTVTDAFEGDSGQIIRPGAAAPWGTAAGTQLLISTDAATGDGGDIDLRSTNGNVTVEDLIASSTAGAGGSISVSVNGGDLRLDGSQILSNSVNDATATVSNRIALSANSQSATNAGLNGGNIILNQVQLSAENSANGLAGILSITSNNAITVNDSSLLANGNDGRILIGAIDLNVSGDIPRQVTFSNSQVSTSDIVAGVSRADGQAGIIELQALDAIAINDSLLESRTTSNGLGGEIQINAPDVDITANTELTTATEGAGNGGEIQIQATDFRLDLGSRIVSRARVNSTGNGGLIDISATDTLQINDDSYLDAGTSGQGKGGDITLSTVDNNTNTLNSNGLLSLSGGSITAGSELSGNGGNITIQVGRAELTNGATVEANTNGTGNAGKITIQTLNTNPGQFALALDNSSIFALLGGNSSGNGEAIAIATDSLQLLNGARIGTETLGTGNAGNIEIESDRAISISGFNQNGFNSGISTSSNGRNSGVAGAIRINQNNPRSTLRLENNGFLSSGTFSQNSGGDIDINVERLLINSGGQILASTFGEGTAGSIAVNAIGSIDIEGTGTEFDFAIVDDPFAVVMPTPLAFSENRNPDQADLTNATFANQQRLDIQQAGFDYYSFNVAAANSQGIFDIDSGSTDNNPVASIDTELFLFNRQTGELLASNDDSEQDQGSSSTRDASIDFIFTDPGEYVIGVGQFDSFASTGSLAQGNTIDRGQTYDLRVSLENEGMGNSNLPVSPNPNEMIDGGLRSAIAAQSEGVGTAGSIAINTPQLVLSNRASVSVSSQNGPGSAGNVDINATMVALDNAAQIIAETDAGGQGNPANITLRNLNNLSVNDSFISSSTKSGTAGNIVIDVNTGDNPSIQLSGLSTDGTNTIERDGIIAEATDGGNAGRVTLTTPSLVIREGARVSTTLAGSNPDANAGAVTVNSRNIRLAGANSGLFSETDGAGNAGNLILQPDAGDDLTVEFENGAKISASTRGAGDGGSVILGSLDTFPNGLDSIRLAGSGSVIVATEAGATGNAGRLEINSGQFSLADGVTLSAESISSLGGDVFFRNADRFELINARITASTEDGTGGGIIIQAKESILLSGTVVENGETLPAGLFVEGGTGQGGLLSLSAPEITIENGAQATASSTSGQGGTVTAEAQVLTIQSNQTTLPNTGLIARTTTGTAGDIVIGGEKSPLTQGIVRGNGSVISAQAEEATGNAGSVSITIRDLTIAEDGQITTQNITGTTALTDDESIPPSGISIAQLETLSLQSGGQISSETEIGEAGTVTINFNDNPVERLIVSGTDSKITAESTEGRAGRVLVNASAVEVSANGAITASNTSGESEGVTLRNVEELQVIEGGQITTATSTGTAGSVLINPGDDVPPVAFLQVDGDRSQISARATGAGGDAGQVQINAQTIRVNDGARISAANISSDDDTLDSNVRLENVETLSIAGGSQISAETNTGRAGSVQINQDSRPVESLAVSDPNSQITARAGENGGEAGSVLINATQVTVKDGANITASNRDGNTEGSVRLQNIESLRVSTGSQIAVQTNTGTAGSVLINADSEASPAETVQVDGNGSQISARAEGNGGEAGSVRINAEQISVRNSAAISASNQNGREGGNVQLQNVDELRVLSGGDISAQTDRGQAGNVVLNGSNNNAASLVVVNGVANNAGEVITDGDRSQISARATGEDGNAGQVRINAQDIRINNGRITASNISGDSINSNVRLDNVETLRVTNGGRISARTNVGQAGSVLVNPGAQTPVDRLVIDGDRSQISARARQKDGEAGSVRLNAAQITVSNEADITASNRDGEDGGSVRLQNVEALSVLSGGRISSQTDTGSAGSVLINPGSDASPAATVDVSGDRSQISARATGEAGNAGQVRINVQDIRINNGRITASNISGDGINSNVRLDNVETLRVTNGGRISARTNTGQAGSVLVNPGAQTPVNRLIIDGDRSQISARATGEDGDAGRVEINAQQLRVQNQGQITIQTQAGEGGDIRLFGLDHAQIQNQGAITAETQSGTAGNIDIQSRAVTVNDGGFIAVQGNKPVEASSSNDNRISRANQSRNQETQGGLAGNLTITANSLVLDQGFLLATTGRNDGNQTGGNITLNLGQGDFIEDLNINGLTHIASSLLLRDGDQTIQVGQTGAVDPALIEANAVGDGVDAGQITITTGTIERILQGGDVLAGDGFIIGLMPEGDRGSDITTNAESGQGGVITINTLGLLGIQVRDRLTSANDITSISEVDGSTGTITINDVGIDPSRGLLQLPTNLVQSPPVNASCGAANYTARSQDSQHSEFVVIGRGGLPQQPTEPSASPFVMTAWVERSIGTSDDANASHTANDRDDERAMAEIADVAQPSEPPTEANSWATDSHGHITLMAQAAPRADVSFSGQSASAGCPINRSTNE
ncbi:MAG: filamentous hemagglutinin N-terminal domain-containing protein [Cyanobacteria bacterium P01_F01_bin.150]